MDALPNPFPVARWHLRWQVERAIHWPDYEGSVLRGLLGHTLRRMACSTGRPECRGCPLLRACAYPALFEPAGLPVAVGRPGTEPSAPFVIQAQPGTARSLAPGEPYQADLVLIGSTQARTDLMLAAWSQALRDHIGPQRGAARWLGATPPAEPAVPLPLPDAAPAAVTICLRTPVRIKRAGQVLHAREFTAADWLFALVRRVADVTEQHLQQRTGLDFSALKQASQAVQMIHPQLHWHGGLRWSNRQHQHTPLDGVLGRFTLQGDLRPFWPLLHLGQWLHVGGKTSFGLGGYRLEPVDATAADPDPRQSN